MCEKSFLVSAACLILVVAGCDADHPLSVELLDEGRDEKNVGVHRGIVERRYRLINSSDNVVTIGRIRKSCGCQFVQVSDQRVMPREDVILSVAMQVLASDSGSFKRVLIEYKTTNDDFELEIPVAVGEVRSPFFSPSSIDFGRVEQPSPDIRRAVYGQNVSNVSGSIPFWCHDFVRLLEGDDGKISIELNANSFSGRFYERVAFVGITQNGDSVAQDIEIRGFINSDVSASPSVAVIRLAPATKNALCVQFAHRSGRPLTIVDARIFGLGEVACDLEVATSQVCLSVKDSPARTVHTGLLPSSIRVRINFEGNEMLVNVPLVLVQ